MRFQKIKLLLLATLVLFNGCGDDDEAATNLPPVIENQSFNANENIDDATVIGTVQASDPEQGTLTFSIIENSNNLFEINNNGELSLTAGSSLDFETASSHTLTVSVSDGNASANALITINVTDGNVAPVIVDQTFEAAENITATEDIGSVLATDADGDILVFSITENADDLFEITDEGRLSLKEDRSLDFETEISHTIIVQVSDGTDVAIASVTIMVNNVIDVPFITTWETTTANESITIHTQDIEGSSLITTFNFAVDWGDGTTTTEEGRVFDVTHTYANAGTYQVSIIGDFPSINFASSETENSQKIRSIDQWGEIEWQLLVSAFRGCFNLTYNATDNPNLSGVESTAGMFARATSFNGDLSGWDMSTITDVSAMFSGAESFNGDISGWNVSNVTRMNDMFNGAFDFNQNLNSWDVSKVTGMIRMFKSAFSFNGDISNWDVSNITSMIEMFQEASSFNQDISRWDVSNVTNMNFAFNRAIAFDQDISGWDVSSVSTMQAMFSSASAFNQNISNWNVSNVTNMSFMFNFNSSFNQDLSGWNVSNVNTMRGMFREATTFNQDLSDWDVNNVTNCSQFASNSAIAVLPNFTNCTP